MPPADFTCSVEYDVDVPCVVMVWKGYATSAQFREANERVLACLREHRATRLVGDISEFVLIGATDQDWLNEQWIPQAIDGGLRRAALVQPNYYFNRVAVDNVRRRVDPDRLSVGTFDTLDDAKAWLRVPRAA
jgi:hypothetical protein